MTSFMMESNRCGAFKFKMVHSINHYVYLIVRRTTITVVLSNKKKIKIPLYMVAGFVQANSVITVVQWALLEHGRVTQ